MRPLVLGKVMVGEIREHGITGGVVCVMGGGGDWYAALRIAR